MHELETEHEEETIKIVNPNKHVHNNEDGGRQRKYRNFSKIQTFKTGLHAIKSCCKDLFDVKQSSRSTQQS